MRDLGRKIELFHALFPRLSSFETNDWEENFLVEFTHDSTSIEGNTLTLIETKMILTDAVVPSETSLRGAGGVYRTVPVYIRGARHVPPNPRRVWDAMKDFVYRMEHASFTDAIEKAAWIHAEFVKIHPFQDGNGRTARLIMNYHLLANDFPPTSIKLQNREAYFSALEEYAIQENLAPFDTLLRENMEREMDAFFTMYAQHIDLTELRQTYPTLEPLAASYIDDAY